MKFHGWLGLGVFAGAAALSLLGVEAVRTWFYQLAWWGYILLADALVHRARGDSLLVDRRRAFSVMCLASATFWFAWELVNLRLGDWVYVGVPRFLPARWLGAFVAYATVLPGVLETYELLTAWGLKWGRGVRPIPVTRRWYGWFYLTGALMLALPLVWPRVFFPLVWGAVVFLLEPLNHRLGAKSLMRAWEGGDLSPFVRLLVAGMICGAFWESWNWLAGARWEYTIPWLAEPKVFAMPLAGYLGFPPFAVECYVFMAAVSLLRGGRGWETDDHQRAALTALPGWAIAAIVLFTLGFDLWMCHMIDIHLVRSWA